MSWPDQIFTWTAYALAGAGVVLMLWALLWDRARGRRRCSKCWYDMSGAPGLTCPECGREAKSERGLQRTRRRWKLAGVGGGLCIAAYAAWVTPEVRAYGLGAAAPTVLLVALAPLPSDSGNFLTEFDGVGWCWTEWRRRRDASTLAPWHLSLMLRRCHMRYPDDLASMFVTRSSWPAGMSVKSKIERPPWLTAVGGGGVLIKPRAVEGNEANHSQARTSDCWWVAWWDYSHSRRLMDLGVWPDHAETMVFDLIVYRPAGVVTPRTTAAMRQLKHQILWRPRVSVPVNFVASIEQILAPIECEDVSTAIEQLFQKSRVRYVAMGSWNILRFGSMRYLQYAAIAKGMHSIGMRIELYADGVVVAEQRFTVFMDSYSLIIREVGYTQGSPTRLQSVGKDEVSAAADAQWVLRITSDPELALMDFEADYSWRGMVEVPVQVEEWRQPAR